MAFSFDPEFRNSLREDKYVYAAIAAIDFGTTFSGFAFSLNHKDGNQDIYLNRDWGNAQGVSTLQTPTCILLSPKKEFVNFGFEAAAKYANLEDGKDQTYYFFDRFKMMLHHSEVSIALGSFDRLIGLYHAIRVIKKRGGGIEGSLFMCSAHSPRGQESVKLANG